MNKQNLPEKIKKKNKVALMVMHFSQDDIIYNNDNYINFSNNNLNKFKITEM